jgi:hypothetical protein
MRYVDYQKVSLSEILLVGALLALAVVFGYRGCYFNLSYSYDSTTENAPTSAFEQAYLWAEDYNVNTSCIRCDPTDTLIQWEENGPWEDLYDCVLEGSNFEGSLTIECSATECRERFER